VKTFKQHSDLEQLNSTDPAYPVMEELVRVLIDDFNEPGQTYSPEDFGFLVLIEPGDIDRELTEIDMPKLTEIYWEGASMRQGFIYAVFLGTDDWGLGFLIPPDLVDGELQDVMNEILDTPPTDTQENIHEKN
jgi:hypothetical protein